MVKLLNSAYLGASTPFDYGQAKGVVELLPSELYLGSAVPSGLHGYINVILSGVSPLSLTDSKNKGINYLKLFGSAQQADTPTPDSPVDIMCNNGALKVDNQGNVYADGTQETISLKDDSNNVLETAVAENLFSILSTKDEQEILSGRVTRHFDTLVLDGTENWEAHNTWYWADVLPQLTSGVSQRLLCTHFVNQPPMNDLSIHRDTADSTYLQITYNAMADAAALKSWLASQYANGTPVIVLYEKTPTTESVTGQSLNTKAGDNTLEITQSSLSGLTMEVSYRKKV